MSRYYRDDTAKTAIATVKPTKTNCFGYCIRTFLDSEMEDCLALKYLYCRHGKCRFFKTQEQYENDLKKAEKRYLNWLMS